MNMPEIYEFHGDWTAYVEELYQIYMDEVANAGLTFNNLPVKTKFQPMTDNKGFGFWHVISDGEIEDERNIDIRRCEQVPWIPYWINQATPPPALISWWKNKRGSHTHIVIMNEVNYYVVILAERNGYYLLKSAYTARRRRAQELLEERNAYWGI